MKNWPHFFHGLAFEWKRIWRKGVGDILLKAAVHILGLALWFVLLPLTIIAHIAGYRRVTVFTDRIGHLAIEPDCLLKEQTLRLIPKRKWFILAPPGRVANKGLLKYWKIHFRVYEDQTICFILASMSLWGPMRYDISHYAHVANNTQIAYQIYHKWADRPPSLTLTQEDDEWGKEALHQMGLPDNAWFVTVHVREQGFSLIDDELHTHRNGNIDAVMLSIEEITSRGGWVIRIGDYSMKQIPSMPQVIDYAHYKKKSERLDIILCAKSKFLLGNTSGIALVASIFGVPCALANIIPMSTLWFSSKDIVIPKLLWSNRLKRYLRFDEVLEAPIADYHYAVLYRQAGIRVDENSEEEILDLVIEMFDRLNNIIVTSKECESIADRFNNMLQKRHITPGSGARISNKFLEKYSALLPQDI